ncbi:MAG: hypothetical protein QOI58_4267 [Thermoanaerobaculia bacterium]|nr:hypothetical protein [Thermoanaerobaculia bacterium]
MLRAYFDESSTENSQFRCFLISGYVSNERGWRQFERKWRHALVCDGFQKHGIHWTDLAAGKEDFESLAGPANEKRRERLQRKYLRIIRSAPLHGLHSSFDMNDFERALPSIRKVRQSKPYRLAYYHAFESVVGRLCALLQANSMLDADEQVAFVFDRNDQTQERERDLCPYDPAGAYLVLETPGANYVCADERRLAASSVRCSSE